MCGIVGYLGYRQAYPILMTASTGSNIEATTVAGIALLNHGLRVYKTPGKVQNWRNALRDKDITGSTGIAHTDGPRMVSPMKQMPTLIIPQWKPGYHHNGIIEITPVSRRSLSAEAHSFITKYDTEVIIHLIEDIMITKQWISRGCKDSAKSGYWSLCHCYHIKLTLIC